MSKLEKKYYPLVFVVPALIIFTLFYVCSIAGGFVFSFTNWSIYNFCLLYTSPSPRDS